MVVPLLRTLGADPALLQQVVGDVPPHHGAAGVEVNLHELAKPGGVVVPRGLGVAERLKDGVCWGMKVFPNKRYLVSFMLRSTRSSHLTSGLSLMGFFSANLMSGKDPVRSKPDIK